MKNIFLILFILATPLLQGQNRIFLKSKDSNQPISYANVWRENKIFTSSDSLGVFYIDEKNINSKFKISAVGYKTIDSVKVTTQNTIHLENDIIKLQEVAISQKLGIKKIKNGTLKSGDVGINAEMNQNIAQIGKYFANNYDEVLYLDKFKFKAICSDKNRVVTILLYSVGENGEPYKIINAENIVCKLKKGHTTTEVDLSNLKMEFPKEGLFIVINYLFFEENKQYGEKNLNWYFYEPSIDAKSTNQFIDTWYNDSNQWKKSNTYSLSFQLIMAN